MKRLNRQEMLDILATLRKANRLSAAPGISVQQLLGILTRCQESAITLGEALERYGEVGEQVIHMLEEYCEALYLQSQHTGNAELQMEFQNGIAALLDLVEEKIQKELPEDKKVVVFLPYKASMWDSLESVWKAAEEDPNCDAYVVPIPYFDRNPDTSFGEMHYEGNEYPDYVPVYSWEEFSIPDMKPDIIFIHNPYDEYNYVTSVHPMFYSSNLKKYTKELVYIPYFINLDGVPEHFCVSPGTMYADLIAVQSEKVKDTYIRVFKQFEIEGNCRNLYGNPERKFLALGSPKTDKAVASLEEHYEVPQSWQIMLMNKKGERKKIVFLNTTNTYILKFEKQYIDHLKEVFDYFRGQEDVLLLWRPHPLADVTFSSMKKDLYEEYIQLIEYYKTNNIGIYDDSANLYSAISICDACYGDNSSVLVLVWAQKKPVMYRNVVNFFSADELSNGKFTDAIYENKGGIRKMLLFETEKYSLKHFLYDIQCKERYAMIKRFSEERFKEIVGDTYINFGCAGREIYKTAKEHLLGRLI